MPYKEPRVKCPKCKKLNSADSIWFTIDEKRRFKCEHCGLQLEEDREFKPLWRADI